MDFKKIIDRTKRFSSDLIAASIIATDELSKMVSSSDWFRTLNDYTSEVSKAMDHDFLLSLKGQISVKMAPIYHRILDGGHDLFSSIDRAREIGLQKGWSSSHTFQEWCKAYFADLSSPAGMPVFGKMTEDIYKFLQSIGIKESTARDMVTVNGQEFVASILSGSIIFLAIIFSWKEQDKDRFSKIVGSVILSSVVTLNPMALAIVIISFGVGYQKLICQEAIARGVIITGSGMLVGSLIPGPILLGAIPAIIVSVYISKKMGSDFKPIEHTKEFVKLLTSKQFRDDCQTMFGEMFEGFKTKAT